MIAVKEWNDHPEAWDRFVEAADDGTVMHLHAWKGIVEAAYGHRTVYLAAREGERIRGLLPLTLIRGGFLRRSLVSMPFMDYGGVCANGDSEAEAALVKAALAVAEDEDAFLTLRYHRQPELALPCSLEKLTVVLPLADSAQAQWTRLPAERRNRVRKAQKSGLCTSVHRWDGLPAFYRVFSTNMRDLGSPVHSLGFFREMLTRLGPRARIVLVHAGRQVVGAGIMLLHKKRVAIPWVSSLRSWFQKCPNQLLYWDAMRLAIAEGYEVLDLGRSSRGSSGLEAKRQWGGQPHQLYWYYYPPDAPPPGEELGGMAWGASMWQRLPVAMTNVIGPWFRRGIAN